MADKAPIHLRGVEGKVNLATGKVTRAGVKAVVVHQPSDVDDPLPYFYGASEEDCREYVKSMKASGAGAGLRVVKPSDVDNGE